MRKPAGAASGAAPPMLDAALAVGLLAVKLLTLALGVQAGGGAVSYLVAPLWTLPLAWRRRHPLAVAVLVVTADVVEVLVGGYHQSVVALLALVLVQYSLGAHQGGWPGRLAGVALVLGVSGWQWIGPQHLRPWDVLGSAVIAVAPVAAGLWVRQQRLHAATLARLAEQLRRERDERARTAVAEERTRIAQELHDEIAHAMSVIAVQADAADGALQRDPALVARPLVAIRDTARQALTDMRRVLGALRGNEAAGLTPEPGLARAAGLLQQAREGGLDVVLQVRGEPTALPPALDLTAYRVLQEGLTNVRKHAAAHGVEIVLTYGPESLGISVTDDGAGAGARSAGGSADGGYGLPGIRERVSLLGGEFVAGPMARGFALRVRLPLT